ncbi:MAG TPA: response regulator [Methylotenera sp.]|jgi:excisionase family DNA binding protein|nr:response regulator [Methylotenera sp.]HQS44588.1 response regulator [Methylotenera sp.]
MSTADDKTLTTREAGVMLGVSLRTVQLWVEAGVLAAWKTQGGHRRVSLESVEKVLAEREVISNLKWNARQNVSPVQPVASSLKVLIAEDNEVYRDLLEFYFKNLDIPVNITFVADGFECLISLGKQLPDIIITDLHMPKISGFDMIRHLAATDAYDDVQIIALTGLTQADIDEKGGLPSRVKVFFKPFSFKQLELIVDELIKRK